MSLGTVTKSVQGLGLILNSTVPALLARLNEIELLVDQVRGENIGDGEGLYTTTEDLTLKFKSIRGLDNISLVVSNTDIGIACPSVSGTGTLDTLQNVGSGIGLFKEKNGVIASLKTIVLEDSLDYDETFDEIILRVAPDPIRDTVIMLEAHERFI